MIHDLLLACMNPCSDLTPIEKLMYVKITSNQVHPLEEKFFKQIIKFLNYLREVVNFSKTHGSSSCNKLANSSETVRHGNYLKSFCEGVDHILEEYYAQIVFLEQINLKQTLQSLIVIHSKLQEFEPLIMFLRKLTRSIRYRKLHGCAIMHLLYQSMHNGNLKVELAIKSVNNCVNTVFLKHLANWTLYGKTDDFYDEYFIQRYVDLNETYSNTSSIKSSNSSTNSSKYYDEVWQWEVCYDLVPHFFSSTWAEKVLFIGKTVLIFRIDEPELRTNSEFPNMNNEICTSDRNTLWNGKEYIFYNKMQSLLREKEFRVSDYEKIVEDMKVYVSNRFAELAVTHVDLIKQLNAIKDFFLMARGELHLEFIRNAHKVKPKIHHKLERAEQTEKSIKEKNSWAREIIRAFELACNTVGAFEYQEKFSLSVIKGYMEAEELSVALYPQYFELNYKIKWPLHLIFSPKVISYYNVVFRFLLTIKKIQYELQMIWQRINLMRKHSEIANITTVHFFNQLKFFINTLQYYIQVDVLESQFNILLSKIEDKYDFEEINRAQSIFQINVLSLCFLHIADENRKGSMYQSTLCISNPVYDVLSEMFTICQDFISFIEETKHLNIVNESIIEKLGYRFYDQMDKLIDILNKIQNRSSQMTLKQLITRLDFNYWYSLRHLYQNGYENKVQSTETSDEDEIFYDTK